MRHTCHMICSLVPCSISAPVVVVVITFTGHSKRSSSCGWLTTLIFLTRGRGHMNANSKADPWPRPGSGAGGQQLLQCWELQPSPSSRAELSNSHRKARVAHMVKLVAACSESDVSASTSKAFDALALDVSTEISLSPSCFSLDVSGSCTKCCRF